MALSSSPKNKILKNIWRQIKNEVPEAIETNRVETSPCSLSFQSKTHPERHICIEFWTENNEQQIYVDLSDLQRETDWGHVVDRVSVESPRDAINILKRWLSGETLDNSVSQSL